MIRVRTRVTPAVLQATRTEWYQWGSYPCTYLGNTYYMPGPHVLQSVSETPVVSTTVPLFSSYSYIKDEVRRGSRDSLKPVYHVSSEIKSVPYLYGAQENTQTREYSYADVNMSAPQQYYAAIKVGSHEPAGAALSRYGGQAFVQVVDGEPAYAAGLDFVLPDRYAQLPARLVQKLDSLHLANIAWEAREFPQLFDMFRKRNRLATKAGLDWIAAAVSDRPKWRAMRALTPKGYASAAFCKWLANNQLGYSFGLAPTVGDALAIANALRHGLKPRSFRTTVTIKQSKEYYKTVLLDGVGPQVHSAFCAENCTVNRVDGCRATLRRRSYYSDVFNKIIPALIGHNPANMIWRALPFSWCVDLVLSIDDVLDSMWCQAQTEYELNYWSSHKVVSTQTFGFNVRSDYSGSYPDGLVEVLGSNGDMTRVVKVYNRYNREPPNPLQSVRANVSPMMGYLTALVALGFLPNRNKR